jgi:hypothetical protein
LLLPLTVNLPGCTAPALLQALLGALSQGV